MGGWEIPHNLQWVFLYSPEEEPVHTRSWERGGGGEGGGGVWKFLSLFLWCGGEKKEEERVHFC